jgi:CPA2 family monovalent cation:H+ antiporter-2
VHDAHAFLQNLALVLCVAAVTTVLFQRLRQPVVFGYLLAGLIVGPHLPVPLVADQATVRTLSELGVILLMFALGLEFNLSKLLRVGPTAGLIALAETSVMVWLGYALGQSFGWGTLESIYAGAVVAISSTTIITKAFAEQRVKGVFTELVLGILIIEDIIAILLLAILTAFSAGADVSAASIGVTAMRLFTFLAVLVGFGLLLVPRFVRWVVAMGRAETTLIVAIGICFAAALLALAFGYSVALGAFIGGSLVGESGREHTISALVQPVRDVFAAIFFVAVGMMLDPSVVARYWVEVLVLTAVVIVGKVGAVTVASFFTGFSPRTSVQTGMSLAQIGEFSFIIAGVGLANGATREFLYPIAVTVSAITTLTTPLLIRGAGPAAAWVDRRLPHRVQTFASLYGSWIDRIRGSTDAGAKRSRTRRLTRLVVLDAALLAVVVIAAAIELDRFATLVRANFGVSEAVGRAIVIAVAAAIGFPLLLGLVHTARLLGLELGMRALPAPEQGKVDVGEAPRRLLVVSLQLAIVAMASLPLLMVTQPFLPPFWLAAALALLLLVLGVAFWRSAANLHGHARAGAEVIVAALANQMAAEPAQLARVTERVHSLLPGMGEPVPLRVPPESVAAGRTLAELDLRGLTGATVLAIVREGEQIAVPSAKEVVRGGDVLAVAGSREAVEACRALIDA